MPFLSPDWRHPGDRWLRSSECGSQWENAKIYRLRIFERMNESVVKRVCQRSLIEQGESSWNYVNDLLRVVVYQPHVYLKSGSVREIIHLLLEYYFHKLTGRSQLFLIELLKSIALQGKSNCLTNDGLFSFPGSIVQASCNQTALFRRLLDDLDDNLERNKYDHMGSTVLWQNHSNALEAMHKQINGFDIGKKLKIVAAQRHPKPLSLSEWTPVVAPMDDHNLENLPPECLSRVLSFINCPLDLETASMASGAMASLVEEEHLWRNLTLTHFDMRQMSAVHFGRPGWSNEPPATINDINWRRAYLRLLRRYGDQHFYTAKLGVCEVCMCLYWPLFGHPCYYPKQEPRTRLLSPEEFIGLFQI